MLLRWRGVDCLCATMLVLLTYFKTSTGDNMTTVLTTTELATTAAEPTTVATTTVTTVALTTQLPNLNPPDNVSVAGVPSNNTVFTVSWSDDDQDPRLTVTYNIIIVNTTDGTETETVTNATSVYTVTGRTPGQEYNVTVVAVDDDNSREEHSDEKTITLQPNTVEGLRRQDSSNTSVTAIWNEPLNSVFDSYDISCSSGTAVPMTITKGGTLEASCIDVMPGRLHTITVATVSGSQSNSDYVDIWSKPNTVQDLEGGNVTTNSVSVKWSLPYDHIDSYFYIVNCSEGFAENENITDGTTTATCSNVTAGSFVTVTVTTYSGLESNADSTMVRAKPNSVDELDEVNATIDSVTASWKKPAGIVTQYNILCSHGNPEPSVVINDDYIATCQNISKPGTECTVTVTSVSDTVAGDSRSINITAYPIPPDLVEGASTETSISVEWKEPNSVVDFYFIDCPNGAASPSNITATDGTLTASCTGLTLPGDLYSISVKSQSNDKLSDAATESINALPENVTLVKSPSLVDTVSATWERPRGVFEQFYVQCAPTDNAVPLEDVIPYDQDASSYAANCSVSIPGDVYNMTVISRSGNQNSSASTIELRALPEAVESFTVVDVTTTTVELQWTMKNSCKNDGCVWSSFDVSHNPDFFEKNVPQNENSTSFTSLTPGQNYTFSIVVLSEDEESSAVTVVDRTKPNIVQNLTQQDSSTTSVTAVWSPPLNSVFDSYDISCSSGTAVPVTVQAGETRKASCTGVASGRLETITVTTVSGSRSNSDDLGIWSKPNTVQDLEGDVVTTNSVSVKWSLPDDHIDSYYYIVDCSEGIADNGNITDGATTATCSPVTAGSLVAVTVTTYSGSESNSDSTTVRAKPNSVDTLDEETATIDSVTASWLKPAGIVTKYKILCSPGEPRPSVVMDDGRPTKYSARCENISPPGTECTMTVTSVSDTVAGDSRSIRITTYPIPPVLLEAASTETSISVEWQKPDSVVDYYIIECFNGTASPSNITATDGTLTASCTGLTLPGDLYSISVQSQSKDKLSDAATESINAKPNIVEGLRRQDSSTTSVTAVWNEPSNSVFDSYDISCSSGTAVPMTVTKGGILEASCNDVMPGRLHAITVATVSGSRRNSDYVDVWSKPNTVQDLEGDVVTTNSVSVKWNQSDDHIDSYYYIVNCSEGFADNGNITDGSTTTATCSPVTAGSLVTVTVTTHSGLESNADSTTVRAKPNSVDELDEDSATINSVTASWKKPAGIVTQYNILCSPGNPQQSVVMDDGRLSKYSATCENISPPGTDCTMTVTSVSDTVPGDSRLIEITTNPIPPVLVEAASTETSISVEWQKPNSVVDYYIIECSNGTASPSNITATDGILTASCTGLTLPGDLYSISVQSQSNDKLSDAATEVIYALPESVILVKSPSLVDTVSATWARPTGVFDLFNISCEPDAEPLQEVILYNPDASSYAANCSVSIPGYFYNMTVVSRSGNQNSSPSTLGLRALPEAVRSFTVEDVTTDMVELQWTMTNRCEDGGCVWNSFDVSHNRNSLKKNVPENGRVTSFTSLTPGQNYTFSIIVLSGEEKSSPVTVIERTIPESVDKFNVSRYSTDFVELYWTIKEICNDNGCVWDSYNLTYTPDGDPEEQQPGPPLDSADLSTSVTNLTPGENYNFSIIAVSGEKGSSPRWFIQRTKPETVEEFSVTSHLTEMVTLSWTIKAMCEDGGCVWDAYSILYTASSDTGGTPLKESRNSLATEIGGLTPGESYDFSITVISGEEESVPERVVQRTLPESVKTFEVAQYTDTMASLSWTIKDKCIPDGRCVWSSFEVSYNSSNATQIPRDSRATPVESLTPGDYYVFFISVKSEEEVSSAETVSQRLRPSDVRSVGEKVIDKRVVTIEWDSPDGVVTGYDTTIESLEEGRGGGESGGFDDNLDELKHTATFVDLTPGLLYEITVCTKSYNEICITPASISIVTRPDKPSEPQDLSLEEENIQTVTVTFSEPALPNGVITEYIIRYSGVKDGSANQEEIAKSYTPEGNPPYSATISDLVAGYTYTFRVTAVNDAGEGAVAEEEITLSQLKPVDSTVSPEVVAEPVGTGIKSFSVMFSSGWFSDCYGELNTYSVFVVEEGGDKIIGDPPRSYKEAQNKKPLPVYVAIANETYPFAADYSSCATQRKKRQASESIEVVIGDETCSDDGRYCNGALHGNREYRVKYQACNDVGCSETEYSEVIKTDLNNASWLVPLIFILVVLICALAMFVVWKERQHPGIITNHFKRPKSGIDNRGFDHDKPMRRQGDNRPVKLAEFGQFLEDMSRDSDYLFSEEYNDLRPIGKNQSTDAAQLEVNRVKNRFSNILPYDHTRVTLSPVDDEEGSDYINANYMLGYKSQREYIACQGPLQSTEEDMWRLVWEQGASIIVMVTQLMENGKIKCHQYWPDEGEGPVRYGEIVVNPMKVQKEQLWTIRKFQITKGPVTRTVTHFNFIAWPDHGVPERPDDLIKFVQAVRECKKMDGKPVVVHCSAGVGRTGTFISLDHLMSAMKEKDEVDIYGMVRSMRMNRCMMVQTESQYIFIHQCVMALLEGSVENDAVYENVNGNGYFSEALI